MAYWHHTATDTCQTKLNHFLLHPTYFLVFKERIEHDWQSKKKTGSRELTVVRMAPSIMASMALKPSPFPFFGDSLLRGIQPSARASSFRVMSNKAKKVQTTQPFGPGGGLELKDGVDASGRPAKGKGVYQFANKYGANVDGYSPIYNPEEWSPSGDFYAGGKTGLLLWVATLVGILLGGALLVYNTSALAS